MPHEVEEVTTVAKETPQTVVRKTRLVTPAVQTEHPQKVYAKKKVIFRTYQVVWYILGTLEILLAFRVLLKLIGASLGSGFTRFIYAITNPFAVPFMGITQATVTGSSIMEWSTLIAMAVYAVVAYGIVEFMQLIKPTTPEEVEETVDNQ